MKEYRVNIPRKKHCIIEFIQEEQPGIAVVNVALRHFEPKEVFRWHLSIMIDFEDLLNNGMPSQQEISLIDPFEDRLDSMLRGLDKTKPNALFLARITWNATRELIWRVYEPEFADRVMQEIIDTKECPKPFDYRMEQDVDWKLAKWHLTDHSKNRG